ncbi:MAG TPA: DUF1674 domain-containing protein [Stellaceae bacterium]|nr:DUF1674 domain-containing protein [Stellaceae bacterium]
MFSGTTKSTDAATPASPGVDAATERNATNDEPGNTASTAATGATKAQEEFGGPQGPEPTRFGDWERNGRCTDF